MFGNFWAGVIVGIVLCYAWRRWGGMLSGGGQ
jgi:hypothetical protein